MSPRFFQLCPAIFSLFLATLLPAPALAEESAARQLAGSLLAATGTAVVFEQAAVQAALKDPTPFLGEAGAPRFDRLLSEAGLRRWQPPRIWLLQETREGDKAHWENAGALVQGNAGLRAYTVVAVQPLPSAVEAIGFLSPGKEHPGLRGLLAAYDADMLVLLRGRNWTAWHAGWSRQGVLPGTGTEFLADVLAEVAAGEQQWPQARGRSLIQVEPVAGLPDFAGVQAALQALPGIQQLQLIRAEKGRVWFAWTAPTTELLTQVLQEEPRLLAPPALTTGLPARITTACRLACQQLTRRWQPDAAKPSPVPALSVQSPAPH